jgi:2,4-dienoyl-CoA reductase-like NADH-dependent reductase (Old Yellow Enzyme family)
LENRMRFPLAVVREVKRVIAAHAERPFLLGYRVSPEEPEQDGLRITDTCALIEHLIDIEVDCIHASLSDVIQAKATEATNDHTIAELVAAKVAGRVPVVAAGQVRTPQQAERALDLGLSLVAVGQGLVMNPEWAELSKRGNGRLIETEIRTTKVPEIGLPAGLWGQIQFATGWFNINDDRKAPRQKASA